MKSIWHLPLLLIMALLSSPQIFACNATTLPYEWPFFAHQESSEELKIEARELLIYLLAEVNKGREYALDAWAHIPIREGIKNALGMRVYRDILKQESAKADNFALSELVRIQGVPNTDQNNDRLAQAENPEFLFNTATDEKELIYFWSKFGFSYEYLPGATPKEKLLRVAIAKKWNSARMALADVLYAQFLQDPKFDYLAEAFRQLRYAAQRGFIESMYKLHIILEGNPSYSMRVNEAREWLEAAAELDYDAALFTSATFFLEEDNFPVLEERLNRLIALEQGGPNLKRSAAYLKDLAFLRERGLKRSLVTEKVKVHRTYNSSTGITPSMINMVNSLRTMFEEIDKMNVKLNKLEQEEILLPPAEAAAAEILPMEPKAIVHNQTDIDSKDPTEKKGSPTPSAKKSSKKKKVADRVDSRKHKNSDKLKQMSQNLTHEFSFADNPFADGLRDRLNPVRGLVKALLDGEHLNGREIQTFFNAFQNLHVENVVGSHNKVNIQYVEEGPAEKITIVSPHKGGKRRDLTGKYKTMSGKLRGLLHGQGLRKIEDLDPKAL